MDIADLALSGMWAALGWAVAVAVLAVALWRAPWRRFRTDTSTHVFFAAVLALSFLWALRAHIGDAFAFHLLGTAALALAVGAPLALFGGAIVVGVTTFVRDASLVNAGLVFLTCVAIPVLVATGVLRFSERRLPPNFFIYIFAGCFFGAGIAFGVGGLAAALVTVAAGGKPAALIFGEYVPYLLYLGFGEATLTGMLLTLAVVYHPRWVATFDDARYLHGR